MTIDEFLDGFQDDFFEKLRSDQVASNTFNFSKYSCLADFYDLKTQLCRAFCTKLFLDYRRYVGFVLSSEEEKDYDSVVKFLEGYGFKE